MSLDLRQLRESAEASSVKPEAELVSRDHSFTVTYESPEGRSFSDNVLSRILDGDERVLVARLAAQRAGVRWDHLPSAHAARIWAIATVAIQLRDPPDWVAKWVVEDDSLLFSIFDVLTMHDSFFFSGDGSESGAASGKLRVAIHTSLSPKSSAEQT